MRDANNPATEIESVDTLRGVQARILAGTLNPGQLRIVREILTPANGTSTDTAVFTGPRANYTIGTDGSFLTVTDDVGTDGTDRLRNIEALRFSDQTFTVRSPDAPTGVTATAGNAQASVTWTAPAPNGGPAVTDYEIVVTDGATVTTVASPGTATSRTIPLTNGTTYQIQVRAINSFGAGDASTPPVSVTPTAPAVVAPTVTAQSPQPGATGVAVGANVTATFSVPVTGVRGGTTNPSFELRRVSNNVRVGAAVSYNATTRTATLNPGANLAAGVQYTATLVGGATTIRSTTGAVPLATQSWTFTTAAQTATVPARPAAPVATAGVAGGAITASATWTAPADGGSPITGYRVRALRMSTTGTVLQTITSAVQPAAARSITMTLPQTGNYRFTVQAINAVGNSQQSPRSNQVAGR